MVAVTESRASQAFAQEAEAADPAVVAAARALAIEGVKLAQDDKCEQAIPKLERAEQLHHGPIVLSQLGECYVQTGRLVEGAEAMRSVLRSPQPENATDAMKRAYANARTTLDSTKGKIAMLTITVDPSSGIDPRVTVDGKDVPDALLGAARPTDPGERQLEASAPGYLSTRRKVELSPGEEQTIALSLMVDPAAMRAKAPDADEARDSPSASTSAAEAPEPAVQASATAEPAATGHSRVPAYVAWGVGVVGIGAGIGFGWVAKDQEAALDKACPNDVCPRAQRAKLDVARTNGTISTVSLSVGLGAAVLGTVLYFLSGGDDAEDAKASLRPGGADLTLRF